MAELICLVVTPYSNSFKYSHCENPIIKPFNRFLKNSTNVIVLSKINESDDSTEKEITQVVYANGNIEHYLVWEK